MASIIFIFTHNVNELLKNTCHLTKTSSHLWWANFMNIVFHSKFQVELQDCERGRKADLADRPRARPPRGALLQQRLQPHVDRRSSQAAKFQGMREDSTKVT